MAGTIDIVTRAFAGLALSDDPLSFHPHLPSGLRRVDFQLHHRGQLLGVSLDHDRLRLTTAADGPSDPVEVFVDDRRVQLPGGTAGRSEEHTSELQSLMRNSYAVFCL